jgi:DNA invertase Pin-like site-specific DNA recombinase
VRSHAEAIRRYAELQGLAISSIYIDGRREWVTLARPPLQRLIRDCHAGEIDTIVTRDPDRLSRDTSRPLALLHIFGRPACG